MSDTLRTTMPVDSAARMQELCKAIRIEVPDLYALLPGWRFDVNAHYPTVKDKVNEWIQKLAPDEFTRRALEGANFGALSPCLFPDASEEECTIGALYYLWIFLWDDQFDCGHSATDIIEAGRLGREAVACLEYSLGPCPFQGPRPPLGPIMSFLCAGLEKIAAGTTEDARCRILQANLHYVQGACTLPLQRTEMLHELLNEDQYMEARKINGAAYCNIALLLYIYHLDIPSSILDHEAMQDILEQAMVIAHITNHIASFVKEMKAGQYDNIVPVLALQHNISLQEAIERACALIVDAREKFEKAAARLPLPTGSPELDEQVKRYVQGNRDATSGHTHWSYLSQRYFGKNPERHGNTVFLHI